MFLIWLGCTLHWYRRFGFIESISFTMETIDYKIWLYLKDKIVSHDYFYLTNLFLICIDFPDKILNFWHCDSANWQKIASITLHKITFCEVYQKKSTGPIIKVFKNDCIFENDDIREQKTIEMDEKEQPCIKK